MDYCGRVILLWRRRHVLWLSDVLLYMEERSQRIRQKRTKICFQSPIQSITKKQSIRLSKGLEVVELLEDSLLGNPELVDESSNCDLN
jgi:hypothetical protein